MNDPYADLGRRIPPNAAFEGLSSLDVGAQNTKADTQPLGAEGKPPRPVSWQAKGFASMAVCLSRVPPETTTLDIYKSMVPLAVLAIEILEDVRGNLTGTVRVRLVPPRFDYWYDRCWCLSLPGPPPKSIRVCAWVDKNSFRGALEDRIMTPMRRWVACSVDFDLPLFGQGFMYQKRTMMVMDEVRSADSGSGTKTDTGTETELKINFKKREFNVFVTRSLARTVDTPGSRKASYQYRIDIRFPWIQNIWEQTLPGGRTCVMAALNSPPAYWRKLRDVSKSLSGDRLVWNGMQQWVRMAFLTADQRAVRDAPVSLHGKFVDGEAVDLGRWTTFRFDLQQAQIVDWKTAASHLHDFDVHAKPCPEFRFIARDDRTMWDCLEPHPAPSLSPPALLPSSSSSLHSLSRQLSFEVAYQLEVCISRGLLDEHTLDVVFLESLAALPPDRSTRILEYVAERNKRVYQPANILRDPKATAYWRKTPPEASLDKDCAVYVRKAIVTPTTIVYATPALEAGNRVLRHFHEYNDRFLRVQFTDELQLGRLGGGPETRRTDDCFTRAFRALKNGIRVGGRHFEFLAFGSSQLRENGAFFFAPTELLSCQDIRDWMGDFSGIKTVAKYAARLGQCLSTTRPVPSFGVPTTVQRIPDVQKGSYCFTDGVGKISKWWARVIASHLQAAEVPSAFQFRMAGAKGVLAVWPDVPAGQVVQIRPSQEKFPTADRVNVLEIVRCSETATATLNQQTIILLAALGVPAHVFMELLDEELAGLEAILQDPQAAVDQLMVRVDQNQTTVLMADMVKAGFMRTDEPFVWALLQLWRSWTLKALKEKARISVEKSAFVLGCVDETGSLRGHFDHPSERQGQGQHQGKDQDNKQTSKLAQIFLQVPDLDNGTDSIFIPTRRSFFGRRERLASRDKYKVVTGLCLVGRNPSLHPGDLRVVEAVDVPALRHLRDVVVFPRTGDRDIPGMCSGGDLDGDDYFVFWDQRLLPPAKFWNYEAMNYEAAREPDIEHITPRHLTAFFVKHMKNDTLPRIAVSHRACADHLEGSAMNPRCLELAQLHSQAVDYAKTGVPALMPQRLSPRQWPHWMGTTHSRTYRSSTALGKIYDRVQVETFEPAYDKAFDRRILDYYPDLDTDLIRRARRIKTKYDLALRRAMAQRDIDNEFEIWSGFVMNRPRVGTDYKVAEEMGRLYKAIMVQFRRLCLREVGGSRDMSKLGPFVSAMYRVTYEEVRIALHEFAQFWVRDGDGDGVEGRHGPCREQDRMSQSRAPLISFPWLFIKELCAMAKASDALQGNTGGPSVPSFEGNRKSKSESKNKAASVSYGQQLNYTLGPEELANMEYYVENGVATHHGIPLDVSVYHGEDREDPNSHEDELYKPMWRLPPGMSEQDVIIEPAAPEENDQPFIPWGKNLDDDDALSTASDESIGKEMGKIVIQRDDDNNNDNDDSNGNTAHEESDHVPDKEAQADTNQPPHHQSLIIVEKADDDDIFSTVNKLFARRRDTKTDVEAMVDMGVGLVAF